MASSTPAPQALIQAGAHHHGLVPAGPAPRTMAFPAVFPKPRPPPPPEDDDAAAAAGAAGGGGADAAELEELRRKEEWRRDRDERVRRQREALAGSGVLEARDELLLVDNPAGLRGDGGDGGEMVVAECGRGDDDGGG